MTVHAKGAHADSQYPFAPKTHVGGRPMQYKQQRQFDALTRSEDVLDANVDVIGALATSAGRQQLQGLSQ